MPDDESEDGDDGENGLSRGGAVLVAGAILGLLSLGVFYRARLPVQSPVVVVAGPPAFFAFQALRDAVSDRLLQGASTVGSLATGVVLPTPVVLSVLFWAAVTATIWIGARVLDDALLGPDAVEDVLAAEL